MKIIPTSYSGLVRIQNLKGKIFSDRERVGNTCKDGSGVYSRLLLYRPTQHSSMPGIDATTPGIAIIYCVYVSGLGYPNSWSVLVDTLLGCISDEPVVPDVWKTIQGSSLAASHDLEYVYVGAVSSFTKTLRSGTAIA
jgi:hypothetical protein